MGNGNNGWQNFEGSNSGWYIPNIANPYVYFSGKYLTEERNGEVQEKINEATSRINAWKENLGTNGFDTMFDELITNQQIKENCVIQYYINKYKEAKKSFSSASDEYNKEIEDKIKKLEEAKNSSDKGKILNELIFNNDNIQSYDKTQIDEKFQQEIKYVVNELISNYRNNKGIRGQSIGARFYYAIRKKIGGNVSNEIILAMSQALSMQFLKDIAMNNNNFLTNKGKFSIPFKNDATSDAIVDYVDKILSSNNFLEDIKKRFSVKLNITNIMDYGHIDEITQAIFRSEKDLNAFFSKRLLGKEGAVDFYLSTNDFIDSSFEANKKTTIEDIKNIIKKDSEMKEKLSNINIAFQASVSNKISISGNFGETGGRNLAFLTFFEKINEYGVETESIEDGLIFLTYQYGAGRISQENFMVNFNRFSALLMFDIEDVLSSINSDSGQINSKINLIQDSGKVYTLSELMKQATQNDSKIKFVVRKTSNFDKEPAYTREKWNKNKKIAGEYKPRVVISHK